MHSEAPPSRVEIVLAVHRPDPVFFEKQIASIRSQTWDDWILHLVLDGAHPGLLPHLDRWIREEPRIRVTERAEHGGSCRTFEAGLAGLGDCGPFIALADQDDIWEDRKLESLVRLLRAHPEATMAFCDSSVIDESDRLLAPSLHRSERRVRMFTITSLLARNSISGHSLLFRSELLGQAVPFPTAMFECGVHHDHWLAMVAALRGDILFHDEVLVHHRLHRDNQIGPRLGMAAARSGFGAWTAQNRRLRAAVSARFRLLGAISRSSPADPGRCRLACWAIRSALEGNRAAAGIYLRSCCAPANVLHPVRDMARSDRP